MLLLCWFSNRRQRPKKEMYKSLSTDFPLLSRQYRIAFFPLRHKIEYARDSAFEDDMRQRKTRERKMLRFQTFYQLINKFHILRPSSCRTQNARKMRCDFSAINITQKKMQSSTLEWPSQLNKSSPNTIMKNITKTDKPHNAINIRLFRNKIFNKPLKWN